MTPVRMGRRAHGALSFRFQGVIDLLRIFLVNADESGSMGGRESENLRAYDVVAGVMGGEADLVILHGFESDSCYELVAGPRALEALQVEPLRSFRCVRAFVEVRDRAAAVARGRELLAGHRARGSTNPRSHAEFLGLLEAALGETRRDVELVVVNSSDGGFDLGAKNPTNRAIEGAMRRLNSRCRNSLASNVLVGSSGSPEALTFFTGDPESFENRLLFSTEAASPGVLKLGDFDPEGLKMESGAEPRYTIQPAPPIWAVVGEQLLCWAPEGVQLPEQVELRKLQGLPGGRQMLMTAAVSLHIEDVELDRNARALFELIARSLSDNPYLRESSREALNDLIAPLERLLGSRRAVLSMLVADPVSAAGLEHLRARVGENTAAIRQALEELARQPRALAGRLQELNAARHLLKEEMRLLHEAMEQQALEKELGFYEAHPNHWLVWLQPAIEALKVQLELTQQDPASKVAHLSTRIRTARSAQDGQARAADRYLDRLLVESRSRRDHLARKADPRDLEPFEQPGRWLEQRCPVTGADLSTGIAAIPFVADRSDLTSGNIMAGGQNVDRIPITPQPLYSLGAVRSLTWGELGQMASPWVTPQGMYNAAIPVMVGPASPALMRELEKAIGWLCTGTSAFGPQMAEALPGALVSLLGPPSAEVERSETTQALLRTLPLLQRYRSYPYAAGTAAFDESGPKLPLTEVWARSVKDAAGSACLASMGCITSLFARALAADEVDADQVALDLYSWGCRNAARSILGAPEGDGSGGLEGVLRMAALFHSAVELQGHPLGSLGRPSGLPAASLELLHLQGLLDESLLAHVLGEPLRGWWGPLEPVHSADFTHQLNGRLQRSAPEQQVICLGHLAAVFERLDGLPRAEAVVAAAATAPPARLAAAVHQGFDILSLDALRPQRWSSPVAEIASPLARMRRRTHSGSTRWLPPSDAATEGLGPSAWSWLESHSALYPLRAWLRLRAAGLIGREALAGLRRSEGLRPVPPVGSALQAMVELVGQDGLDLLTRRAFAFVVANAHGYADNQWSQSSLREAGPARLDQVLGAVLPPRPEPRRYTASDRLRWREVPGEWPRMDRQGYLPKSRAVDSRGEVRFVVELSPEERLGDDALLASRAVTRLIERLRELDGDELLLPGLHRQARQVLGEHPEDLSGLGEAELDPIIQGLLVPRLAGKITGDLHHPSYFRELAVVLYQLCALGTDTRSFRGPEPAEMLAEEAARLRG